jgi:hypothetical protein
VMAGRAVFPRRRAPSPRSHQLGVRDTGPVVLSGYISRRPDGQFVNTTPATMTAGSARMITTSATTLSTAARGSPFADPCVGSPASISGSQPSCLGHRLRPETALATSRFSASRIMASCRCLAMSRCAFGSYMSNFRSPPGVTGRSFLHTSTGTSDSEDAGAASDLEPDGRVHRRRAPRRGRAAQAQPRVAGTSISKVLPPQRASSDACPRTQSGPHRTYLETEHRCK